MYKRQLGYLTVRHFVFVIDLFDEDRLRELDSSLSIILLTKCKLAVHIFPQLPFVLASEGLEAERDIAWMDVVRNAMVIKQVVEGMPNDQDIPIQFSVMNAVDLAVAF